MSSSELDEFEVIDQLEASLSQGELAKIQAWLQPTDYDALSSEFRRHLSSRAPGTGLWVCETSKYQQWQKSVDHGSLWIKGVPGAGKSVIASSMIAQLQETAGVPVLYFFFRHIISTRRRPRSLIRDFLSQLLPHCSRLQATLQPLLGTDLDDFSDEILWEHLLTGLASTKKVFCVVDALDEMELLPNDAFLDRLNKLATFRPNSLKLIMTSRPRQDLQSSLRDTSIVHISLEDDLVGKDIRLYVSYRLKNHISQYDQQDLRESLVSIILKRSSGLFIYARLLLDQIIPSLGSAQLDIEGLVKTIPVGLEQMYNTMLFQQARSIKVDIQIQVFILELATHSSRALRLNELACILAFAFPSSMMLGGPKLVARSACAPLLEISEDQTVQVIHHSFTEFLLNGDRVNADMDSNTVQFPVLNSNKAHRGLSNICLDYLRSGGLRTGTACVPPKQNNGTTYPSARRTFFETQNIETDGYDYQEAKLQYPFLEYAVSNWAFHASKYDFDDSDFFESVAGFLDPNSIDFRKWLELEWTKGAKSSDFQAPTPLHIAAFAGLTKYAKKLLDDRKFSVDCHDADDRTPLHWACARGHTTMASLLLECGAAPNAEDCQGVKPIHDAARKNHASIVKMLLEAGVDPLTPKMRENKKFRRICGNVSTKGETAAEYAYLQGHTDTIMTMLPYFTPETLEEIFCQCCRYGKFEAVRGILERSNMSPNARSSGATALYLACRAQSVSVVELLLAHGADVHQTSEWVVKNRNCCGHRERKEPLRTNIHAVVMGWKSTNHIACQQIVSLLLGAGADLEARDADGDTPLLSLFADHGSPDNVVVKGLLRLGADVLAVDKDGDTVLHRCLRVSQEIQTLALLFEYGANVNSTGNSGQTVMHTVLRYHRADSSSCMIDVINFFLEKGARCDVKNNDGSTAVEDAAMNSHCSLEVFMLLLEACCDADLVQRCMWKLSSRPKSEETVEFVRQLQKFGASLEDRNTDGETILLASLRDDKLLEAFIECGADLNVVDSGGRGVLHHYILGDIRYAGGDPLQRFVEMVDMGLNPKQVDYDGNTLLHLQAKIFKGEQHDDSFIQKLQDYGISANEKNKKGMTPLHVYLDNWGFQEPRTVIKMRIDERFNERFELSLLKILQRDRESFEINSQDAQGLSVLHLAALRSETCLFYLLEKGADPSILTNEGRSVLHLACRARQSNIVGYLCQTSDKIMINQRDSYGRTPLHDACTSGCPESVHHLLKAGADITIVDNNSRTPLHACAEFSDEQKIWALLARRNKISGHVLADRFRPMTEVSDAYYEPWYASTKPVVTSTDPANLSIGLIVETLLLAGSDAMAVDNSWQTPLDVAITYDCQEMIQIMQSETMQVQKQWNIQPEDRRLPTLVALKSRFLSTKDLQEPSLQHIFQDPLTYLRFFTFHDIKQILKENNDVAGVEAVELTAFKQALLYIAASKGFTQLLESFGTLVSVNDDPSIVLAKIHERSSDSEYDLKLEYLAPTLHVVCARNFSDMDMIQVLVEKCAVDVNAHAVVKPTAWAKAKESVVGGTALHILAKANYWWQLDAVEYLLRRGAKLESLNEKGETPLHIACTGAKYEDMNCTDTIYGFWRIECVKKLLDLGADPNILDNDGLSCLHKASSSPQIMRILLDHGADITAGKFSPLFSAIQIQCLETLKILLDAGISPNVMDHSADNEGFRLHFTVTEKARWALFCASFSNLHNQQAENSAPLVKLLIERGADIYAPLDDKETLVHYVFEYAEFEIVRAFLDSSSRIDFNAQDQLGRSVLLSSCNWRECLPGFQHRHWDAKATAPFLECIDLGANSLVVDNDGRNPLHHLLDNPEMEEDAIVQFLSHDAAKPLAHQKDGKGFTPLHCALRFLRPAVVEVLLTMGADLLSPDPTGATALHHIATQCLRKSPPLRGYRYHSGYQPEFYTGLRALWEKFLALGGSINVRDKKGSPPLFSYLSSRKIEDYSRSSEDSQCHLVSLATYFSEGVARDVDFHAKNHDGENALHIIARREQSTASHQTSTHDKELYECFVGKGLNPLEEDERGRSSLDIAAACEQHGILELFRYEK
ncbi:ankyrin-3 [Coleophoma cylindrospora]|uniref:Ankyrin-3 n=1 Tax=Coleophoma cylindrospora TaxID=1849047 RepID=A0A3D8RHU0_9HELO|nr:ankyrin-3 [Coleophoma cylindrospora]